MKLFRFLFMLAFVLVGNVQSVEQEQLDKKQDHEGSLTELFAVELDKDDEKLAREVAELHGFEFGGRIGSLPGHFQLIRKKSTHAQGDDKRGEIPYPSLREHPNVKWHEQQRELTLEKRVKYDRNNNIFEHSESERPNHSELPDFDDPMFLKQWYINNPSTSFPDKNADIPPGRDMGILKAWKMGYTGKGVVVTVMDDGLDHSNIDLKGNFDFKASYDLNDNDTDPQPRDAMDQYHGTKCSGEIAATANNKFCGVGLAPHVNIGAVRMLDGKVTGITEAGAFGLNPDYIDIYSASWGPKDNGETLAGPSSLGKKALEQGAKNGRKGKGSIYVWASGNGGAYKDDCGCDGYASSIFTIAVGSVGPHGNTTYYDERCAATMAVVYSGDDSEGGPKPLVTTARGEHGCVEHFGGTSAAAPLAVGVFALVLQANPNLTWRDLQHLITRNAKTDDLDKSHEALWKTNAAGFQVSSHFGFGLLYAPALIKAAKKWKTVAPQRNCTVKAEIKRKPLRKDSEIVMEINSDACEGTDNHITKLEHVQIVINLRHRQRGVLSISIEAPSKTKSQLLQVRPHDDSKLGVTNWPFMSVQFWGENPKGTWKLTIKDNTKLTADKRANAFRHFDSSEIQERSEAAEPEENIFKLPAADESYEMPFRHEIELEDESEADESEDESEDEGRRDYAREEDEQYNIFDVRSNVHGELESWYVVQYGTKE